jgi:hypothetical protein
MDGTHQLLLCTEGLNMNGTHQLLLRTYDINLLTASVNTFKKHSGSSFAASKEGSLERNNDKSLGIQDN